MTSPASLATRYLWAVLHTILWCVAALCIFLLVGATASLAVLVTLFVSVGLWLAGAIGILEATAMLLAIPLTIGACALIALFVAALAPKERQRFTFLTVLFLAYFGLAAAIALQRPGGARTEQQPPPPPRETVQQPPQPPPPPPTPQRLRFVPGGTYFHADGAPAAWYSETNGTIELWSAPGTHPVLGTPLAPVTRDVLLRLERAALPTPQPPTDLRGTTNTLRKLAPPPER